MKMGLGNANQRSSNHANKQTYHPKVVCGRNGSAPVKASSLKEARPMHPPRLDARARNVATPWVKVDKPPTFQKDRKEMHSFAGSASGARSPAAWPVSSLHADARFRSRMQG